MLNNLNGWHLLIVLAIVLLLFGAPRLPGLARSVGQSLKIFKAETKTPPVDGTATTAGQVVETVASGERE